MIRKIISHDSIVIMTDEDRRWLVFAHTVLWLPI